MGESELGYFSGSKSINVRYFCILGVCWYRDDPTLAVGNLYLKVGTNLHTIINTTSDAQIVIDGADLAHIQAAAGINGRYFIYPYYK